jgi:hypothetical protein
VADGVVGITHSRRDITKAVQRDRAPHVVGDRSKYVRGSRESPSGFLELFPLERHITEVQLNTRHGIVSP